MRRRVGVFLFDTRLVVSVANTAFVQRTFPAQMCFSRAPSPSTQQMMASLIRRVHLQVC